MKIIIYTDMDGTILDHYTYSFEDVRETLELLNKKQIPIIFCTSKTKAEILFWKKKLSNNHPFISENGGGIFIPKNYFNFNFSYDKIIDGFYCIILGEEYIELKKVLDYIKKDFKIKSFDDMDLKEISRISNFSIEDAKRAKKRDFEIPFIIKNKNDKNKILKRIKEKGFNYMVGGRYNHILGDNSKGKAVKILNNFFKKEYGEIYSIGIGDSYNDFSMLDEVDKPILVMNGDKEYVSDKYNLAGDVGPKGWNKIIKKELKDNSII